jgi:hypothetical protein
MFKTRSDLTEVVEDRNGKEKMKQRETEIRLNRDEHLKHSINAMDNSEPINRHFP